MVTAPGKRIDCSPHLEVALRPSCFFYIFFNPVVQYLGFFCLFLQSHPLCPGNNMNVICTCVTHVAYFLLASLCVTFLHTPAFTRIVLLLLVPINALSKIRHGVGLEFSGLTILITGVAIGKNNLFV